MEKYIYNGQRYNDWVEIHNIYPIVLCLKGKYPSGAFCSTYGEPQLVADESWLYLKGYCNFNPCHEKKAKILIKQFISSFFYYFSGTEQGFDSRKKQASHVFSSLQN